MINYLKRLLMVVGYLLLVSVIGTIVMLGCHFIGLWIGIGYGACMIIVMVVLVLIMYFRISKQIFGINLTVGLSQRNLRSAAVLALKALKLVHKKKSDKPKSIHDRILAHIDHLK